MWRRLVKLYPDEAPDLLCPLDQINLDEVADLVIGRARKPSLTYLAQMLYGPMDVDKIDYMQRDAMFTGLRMQVDLDRLFYTMKPVAVKDEHVLGIDLAGVAAVEQITFNKTLLYSSVYHHHKVRTALCHVRTLLEAYCNEQKRCSVEETKPSDILRLDELALLAEGAFEDGTLGAMTAKCIRERKLLKRALVLCPDSLSDSPELARTRYIASVQNRDVGNPWNRSEVANFESELAASVGVRRELVFFDIPRMPSLDEAESTIVVLHTDAKGQHVETLGELYPTDSWSAAFCEFKHRSYVLGPESKRSALANAAIPLLEKHFGLKVNRAAVDMAKHDDPNCISCTLPPAYAD